MVYPGKTDERTVMVVLGAYDRLHMASALISATLSLWREPELTTQGHRTTQTPRKPIKKDKKKKKYQRRQNVHETMLYTVHASLAYKLRPLLTISPNRLSSVPASINHASAVLKM